MKNANEEVRNYEKWHLGDQKRMGVIWNETLLLYPLTAGINGLDQTKIMDSYDGVNIATATSGAGIILTEITAISTGIQDMIQSTKLSREIGEHRKDKQISTTLCFLQI